MGPTSAATWELPHNRVATELYVIFRACERVDPNRIYGRSFYDLEPNEQLLIMAYADVRHAEDIGEIERQNKEVAKQQQRHRR